MKLNLTLSDIVGLALCGLALLWLLIMACYVWISPLFAKKDPSKRDLTQPTYEPHHLKEKKPPES